jgi:TolA-binding protein
MRDPDGPDAPERAWMIVKSLVDLQRFSEAKDEAQAMVNRYPGTSWAQDVQRHLLSNPL